MKTLSVQQPWATLICSGIKDVENRSWAPKEVPGRILIHASSTKARSGLYNGVHEYSSFLRNARDMGWIPEYSDLACGAIIGYVDVVGFTEDSDSFWAQSGCIHWQLKNAYMFDEPIMGVRGQLNLFDYPLDEENLPSAHKIIFSQPELVKKTLRMPASKGVLSAVKRGCKNVIYDLVESNANLFCDVNTLEPLDIKAIELFNEDEIVTRDVDAVRIITVSDDNDEPICYVSEHGEEMVLMEVNIDLK